MEKIEYRVRPVTRYVVTRYHEKNDGKSGECAGSEPKGEFDNPHIAYDVAYALAKDEHYRLGWVVGDERIKYPDPVMGGSSTL
jgi:hypothetical protein